MKRFAVLVLIFLLPVASYASNLDRRAIESEISDVAVEQFLTLFHNVRKRDKTGSNLNISISEEAATYIKTCCSSVRAATTLLKRAEFELHEIQNHKIVALINRRYGKKFDRIISGKRSVGSLWFFPIVHATSYDVILLIKGGQVENVEAGVNRTSL